MGISDWAFVLVYQRHDMSWGETEKLAREDEDVPTVRGVPVYVAYPL
jgi:hypothetical protein